jgi:hypothetical protein
LDCAAVSLFLESFFSFLIAFLFFLFSFLFWPTAPRNREGRPRGGCATSVRTRRNAARWWMDEQRRETATN